jgi:hypothetical protein
MRETAVEDQVIGVPEAGQIDTGTNRPQPWIKGACDIDAVRPA